MATHKTAQRYVVLAPNGLAVEDTEAVGKAESIKYFLVHAGYKGSEIATPQTKYNAWERYKKRGFKCVLVDEFIREMDEVDRLVDGRAQAACTEQQPKAGKVPPTSDREEKST